MTIKFDKHRLKIIFQNDDFQNDQSIEETLKNVVLQLIIKMLLKKHTQFCSVGIFEGFIEARICFDIIWWRRRGWGPFVRLSFLQYFRKPRFFFEDLISNFRLRFDGVFVTSPTSVSSKGSFESSSSLYYSLSDCEYFFHWLRENLRHLQAWRYLLIR